MTDEAQLESTTLAVRQKVFFDEHGRRGRTANWVGLSIAAVVTVFIGLFVTSVLINPFFPQLKLKPIAGLTDTKDGIAKLPETPPLTRRDASLRQESSKVKAEKAKREDALLAEKLKREALVNSELATAGQQNSRPLSIGFYVTKTLQ